MSGRTARTAVPSSRASSGSARSRATAPSSRFDVDHPEIFASEDNGATPVEYVLVGLAGCLTAGVAAVAQNREIQLRSVTATIEGAMDVRGILGIDSDVRNGFSDIKVTLRHRRRRDARRDQGARRAVAEALGGVRHHHEPDRRERRGRLSHCSAQTGESVRTTTGRHRRRPRRARDESAASRTARSTTSCSSASEVANSWRTERWDSLRLLTPNWQCRLPGYAYDGRRSRRLHDDARGRRLHHAVCTRGRRARAAGHDGDVGTCRRRRLPRRHRPGRVAVHDRRARDRRVQRAPRARLRRGGAVVGGDADADGVPQSRTSSPTAACSSSARRRAACRSPTRSALGPPGHVGRRRARARAARVPRPRHPLVDGGGRRARRTLRRGRRHRARAPRAVDATGGFARRGRRSTSTRSPTSA